MRKIVDVVNKRANKFLESSLHGKHKAEYAFICAGIAVLLVVAAICVYIDLKDAVSKVKLIVSTEHTQEQVYLYESKEACYGFLPSYVKLEEIELSCPGKLLVEINGKQYSGKGFFSSLLTDTEYDF